MAAGNVIRGDTAADSAASAGETAFGWSRDQFWAFFFFC